MILLVIFLLFASTTHGDAALDSLVEKMQNKYENLGTLKANFTQSYISKRFSDRIAEEGVVYFRRGGYMKWEYQKPERKLFICDGHYFIYYVPEDKQAIKASMDRSDVHSPALFLAGQGNFLTDFRAEWADPRPGSNFVKLIPVRPQLDFKYLNAQVDPASGLILRLVVVDSYENRTEYSFQQIKENPSLSEDFFHFRPPPGTDVIVQDREGN